MRIKDVPLAPAYLVYHDAFDNGAMEIWPCKSIQVAENRARYNNDTAEQQGYDESATWKAYEKLPRVRVYKFHPEGD